VFLRRDVRSATDRDWWKRIVDATRPADCRSTVHQERTIDLGAQRERGGLRNVWPERCFGFLVAAYSAHERRPVAAHAGRGRRSSGGLVPRTLTAGRVALYVCHRRAPARPSLLRSRRPRRLL